MTKSFGSVLRQARQVRELSAVDASRAARISPAYLNKLENDVVKRPSPHVLHQLSEALMVPYAELMRLSGYLVPGESTADAAADAADTVSAALFADLTDDERDELLEYLAWHRARRPSGRSAKRATLPVAPLPIGGSRAPA